MNGILIINKPADFTSFDAVAVARRVSKQKKIGHCGTLDPNATGVLPVLLGIATKAQDILPNHDKEYIADFKFGLTSDTLDIWGEVTEKATPSVAKEQLEEVLCRFRGDIMQVPPMYSALKQNGQRLYDLARQGIEVKREARPITVYSLELLQFDEKEQEASIRVSCSKGTYIRSLIDDIGNTLGCGAVMTALCRTSACGYDLSRCISMEELKEATEEEIKSRLLPVETLFERYRRIQVSPAQGTRFSNGGSLSLERFRTLPENLTEGEIVRVKFEQTFLGLGKINLSTKELKFYKLFKI